MGARLIGFGTIGLIILIAILITSYVLLSKREPKAVREFDVSARPSMWWADSRAITKGTCTEISIVRVDNKTAEVLERRVLEVLDNDQGDYGDALEHAQDRAYEAARKANLGLVRR